MILKRLFTSVRSVEGAQAYLLEQLKANSYHTYYAANAVPKAVRTDYLVLHQFLFELGSIPETTSDKVLAATKLGFWQGSLKKIFQKGKIDEDPLSIAINSAVTTHPLSEIYFQRMFKGWGQILESVSSLAVTCDCLQSVFTSQLMLINQLLRLDYLNDPDLIRACELVGRANGLAFLIRRLPFTLRKGWMLFPTEVQQRHGYTIKNLWKRNDGIPRQQLYDSILEVAAFARDCLKQAEQLRPKAHGHTVLISAIETQYFLQQLEKYDFNPFQKGVHRTSYWELPKRMRTLNKGSKFLAPF